MKTLIVSYSLTGNNRALATALAKSLQAEHVTIEEAKSRGTGKIAMDVMLKRTPKIQLPAVDPSTYDTVLFVAPVWMGQIATPLRACMAAWAPSVSSYGFVSISGGADGPNPNLSAELETRMGKAPSLLQDLHIADLLPEEPKPTRSDTSSYRLAQDDVRRLAEVVVSRMGALADMAS